METSKICTNPNPCLIVHFDNKSHLMVSCLESNIKYLKVWSFREFIS